MVVSINVKYSIEEVIHFLAVIYLIPLIHEATHKSNFIDSGLFTKLL